MPAKGGRRGRKHKGTSHVVPAIPPVESFAKPASYKPIDYSKFDNLFDSDEESEHAYTPADLGLGNIPLGETEPEDEERECACVQCRERAEAAEQAAAAAAAAEKQRSNSSKSVAVHSSSNSEFDYGKALKSISVKAKIAEEKANCAHGIGDSTLRFPVRIPCEKDVTKVLADFQKQSNSAKPVKKSGHSKASKSIASNELSDSDWRPDLNPTFDICCEFVHSHLPARGNSDDVVRTIVIKLMLMKESQPTLTPMVALTRIFAEHRLTFDSADLIAFAKKCMSDRKQQQNNRKQQPKPKDAPDLVGFQAMTEKQGLANANHTFSFTSLSGNHQQHTQPGLQGANSEANMNVAGAEASGESTSYESSSEDGDKIPPLVDIDQDVCPPWFPASSSGFNGFSASSKPAAKQTAAAKSFAASAQPSAASSAATPAAKPAAATVLKPAKPLGKAASTASKPSLARSTAKPPAVARASQPQHVTTVSDDDDNDDEEMPTLVSSDDSDEDVDHDSDASSAPPSLLTSDEEDDFEDRGPHEKALAPSFNRIAAEHGRQLDSTAQERSHHRPPPKGNQQMPSDSKARGKANSAVASTEGKAALPAASAEPMFRAVSRGFLAQQTSSLAAKAAQIGTSANAVEDAVKSGLKDASSGTPFLFNRAVAGGSKEPATGPSGKADTASKADSSVPGSQQLAYPFPQHETSEEYKAAMGIGGLNHGQEDAAPGTAFQLDPAGERHVKYAAELFSRGTAAGHADAADEARKRAAADEIANQLLEEEEHDKAEAAAKAEKSKKEKQRTKKAKQKAKKKAPQNKAGSKRSQAAPSTSVQPSNSSQADSSESEEEEERERFSLLDSRFASLMDASDGPLVELQGAEGAPALGQESQLVPTLSTHDSAAGLTTAESGNEEEGRERDNTMMQFGGAYCFLSTVGRGSGPASEKSHSSQDSSSRLPSLPVLPPGESPLLHVKNAPQVSRAGSSNQVPEPQHIPLGLRPGAKPGMDPTHQSPVPQRPGVRPSQPGSSAAQTGTVPSPDPTMSLVLETCGDVVREMEEASGAGDKGRLQEALKEAVNWLSRNGSNPDVATNSAQVRRALHDAKAKLRELGSRPALPQARPAALSSAAPAASRFTHSVSFPSGSMASGTERTPGTTTRQALLDLASEARRHPFGEGQPPPPPPPRAGQPPPPPHRIPPGPPGAQGPGAVRTSAQPGIRPYLHPHQLPPGGMRPAGIQAPQGPFRLPYPQQPAQEPYRQPYPGGLEPYRPVAGGRGVGPAAGRGPAGRPSYTGPGQGPTPGIQQAPTPQEEVYSAYRQRQAPSRPPAMPTNASLPRQPGHSQPASYGSDYGSLDRSSMSGSEATSPVKSMEARYEAKTKYVQPVPFGICEQPSVDEYDETDCVVCMDDVRCTIFVPCGHCLCCQSCAETVVQKYKQCPVCGTPVDGFCATRL